MTFTTAYLSASVSGPPKFMGCSLGDGLTIGTAFVPAMALVDGSGNQITSFGGGTQYAQGTTQATPTGTVALGINPSNVLNALTLDASGYLQVNIKAGAGSGGTASSFGSAFPTTGTAIGVSNGTNMVAITLGQATMANSLPVALASNQSSIPVTQSGTWPVTQSGTWNVGLSAGSNTIGAVTQASGPWTSNITQVGGSALALGQTTLSASLPVAIASNQGNLPANITQFGGSNIVTGTGASGSGIPRVTVSNDSLIQVIGAYSKVTQTPTYSTSAYSSGFVLGGVQTIATANRASGASLCLQSVQIADANFQGAATDIYIFDANPSTGTYTDHAAFSLNATDATNCRGVAHVTDWSTDNGTVYIAQWTGNIPLLPSSTSVYAIIVLRAAATYTSTGHLKFSFIFNLN